MTDNQRTKAVTLLNEGKTTEAVARSTKLSVPSVRALKANLTRANAPKFFEVSGTWMVEATSREDAELAVQRSRMPGTRIISAELHSNRVSATIAADINS